MRTFVVACLTLGLFLQVGCVFSPKMMMVKRKSKPNQKETEEFLAARRLESRGKFETARERYEGLIKKHPDNPDYLHRQGVVCTQLQRFPEAAQYYERARKLDPKNVSLLTDMGYTFHIQGKQEKAERLLRKAIELSPGDKRAVSNLALVVGAQGEIDESFKLLKGVGDEADALAGVAYIHSRRGEMELAEQKYRDALELNPQLKDAVEGLAVIEKQKKIEATLIAKQAASQEKSEQKSDVSKSNDKSNEIQQVAATKNSDSQAIKAASFTEDWLDFDEPPRLNRDQQTKGDQVATADFSVESEEVDTEGKDSPAELPSSQSRSRSCTKFDWDEDEAASESDAAKPSKKLSSIIQDDFDLTNGEEDPFTFQTSRGRNSSAERFNVRAQKTELDPDDFGVEMDAGDVDDDE